MGRARYSMLTAAKGRIGNPLSRRLMVCLARNVGWHLGWRGVTTGGRSLYPSNFAVVIIFRRALFVKAPRRMSETSIY